MTKTSKYLDTNEAAAFLGVKPLRLRQWRCWGRGPVAVKVPGVRSSIFYPVEELKRFRARKINPAYAYGLDNLAPIDLAAKRRAYDKRQTDRQLAKLAASAQP
jgi:hypothetical protein